MAQPVALAVGATVPRWLAFFPPDALAGSMLNPIVFTANIILMTVSNGISTALIPRQQWDSLELPLDIEGLDIMHHWDHTTLGQEAAQKLQGLQMQVTGNDSIVFNNDYFDGIEGYYELASPVSFLTLPAFV